MAFVPPTKEELCLYTEWNMPLVAGIRQSGSLTMNGVGLLAKTPNPPSTTFETTTDSMFRIQVENVTALELLKNVFVNTVTTGSPVLYGMK